MKTDILIVEDDPHIRFGLNEVLTQKGYTVAECARGDEVEQAYQAAQPSLIVLDVMLPEKSGFDVCKQLRRRGVSVPILMLTAKGQEMDKIVGLESGADDYVTKPFSVGELLARIQALLRRCGEKEKEIKIPENFVVGNAQIDLSQYVVRLGKKQESLTAKEAQLLELFYRHQGQVLSREKIFHEIWGQDYYGTTRTLDQTMAQIRKKIGDQDAEHLQTIHGVGYKWAGLKNKK